MHEAKSLHIVFFPSRTTATPMAGTWEQMKEHYTLKGINFSSHESLPGVIIVRITIFAILVQ